MPSRIRASRPAGASDEDRFWSRVDKNGPVPAHRPDRGAE